MPAVDISHIVTVFNKQDYLKDTIASLLNQEGSFTREFIFVDDVSTDRSLEVIEECTRGMPHVSIIRNQENKGPSVRLNQGAALAKGKYLHFLDSDDIVPKNAIRIMYETLQKTGADMLYGKWKRAHRKGSELLAETIPEPVKFQAHDKPLLAILQGHFTHMCTLVSKEVFDAAGGCDERIFIQDESLPIRLASESKRFVAIDAYVNLVPLVEGQLSHNKPQEHHDRFLAYYYMLKDKRPKSHILASKLYARALASTWKEYRKMGGLALFSPLLIQYGFAKHCYGPPSYRTLEKLKTFFASRPGIRRV